MFIGVLPGSGIAGGLDAEALLRRGQVQEALAAANREAADRPDDVGAQELVVDIMLTAGDQAGAEQTAIRRVAANPEDPDSHYLLGRVQISPEASRQSFEAALRLAPDHARSHMGMGSLHEAAASTGTDRTARLADAEAAYARAVRYDPSLGEAWFGRARVLVRLGRRADALAAARDGWSRAPEEPDLALLVSKLDPSSAAEVLEQAVAIADDVPEVHEGLADAYLRDGNAAGALDHANRALALNDGLPGARLIRAYAREVVAGRLSHKTLAQLQEARKLETRNPAAALGRYPALTRRAPRSAMVLVGRAAAKRASGDTDGELNDLVAAAKLDEGNDEVAALAGQALSRSKRYEQAMPLLTAALAARPADPDRGLALAQALQASGHVADAKALLSRVASGHPTNVGLQLAYIQLLLESGAVAEAYGVTKVAMQLTLDPRLVAAFVKVAPAAGRSSEAASILEPLAERSNSAELRAIVARLRDGR